MSKTKLDQLLSREMTRRQFLAVIGLGFVSFFGFSSLVSTLTENSTPIESQSRGYGINPYGGS